jgi:glycosyltransferase involved in cell wall biosynthesis
MKIYLSNLNESWIVDRIRNEWYKYNPQVSTKLIFRSDVIWIIAPWLWRKIPRNQLKSKKVVCTFHHIDKNSMDESKLLDFKELESYVDLFHVISNKTKETLSTLTNKPIASIPLWVNQHNWFYIENKSDLRKQFGFGNEDFLIGSFQRDTEGHDLKSPKLIKGPDIFIEIIKKIKKENKNLKVVLTGKRRQYVIKKLNELKVPFEYYEMVSLKKLNELYNVLNLYIVSSRLEGGPQAIVECGITKTPVISTNVGIAPEILNSESIFHDSNYENAKPDINTAYENSKQLSLPIGMEPYIKLFEGLF